jgi:hypothetical protein
MLLAGRLSKSANHDQDDDYSKYSKYHIQNHMIDQHDETNDERGTAQRFFATGWQVRRNIRWWLLACPSQR